MLLNIILASIAVSALSLSGVFLLFLKEQLLKKTLVYLVAFAGGTLLGAAFLHLLPEAIEEAASEQTLVSGQVFLYMLIGFLLFFLMEITLHWHTHQETQEHAPLGPLILVGDGLHNFIDGIILAAMFSVDTSLGLIGLAAIALHEIPQEISEFGVLLYSGFSKRRALLFNFLSALAVIPGGIVGYLLAGSSESLLAIFLPFAVGSFLYLGASAFVPEIRRREASLPVLVTFGAGLLLMWLLTFVG